MACKHPGITEFVVKFEY